MDQATVINKPNPRDKAGILSRITFAWIFPLLCLGKKRPLEQDDLYRPMSEDSSKLLGDQVSLEWEKEQKLASESGRKPSYLRALVRCFGWSYFQFGLLAAIEECVLRITQPIFLGLMIRYFNGEPGYTQLHGWLFACGLVAGSLFYIFTHHPFFWGIQHCGMQIRIASCSLLYRKALKLSKAALGKTTVGHLVNLLSNDVNRFDTSVIFFHYLWIGPLQLIISTAILWYEIGPSCIAGLVLLIMYVPFQSWMGKMFSKLRLATAKKTDIRIRIMNEIVNAIRVIKMYTWEKPFSRLIDDSRKNEIDIIMETNYYRAMNMSLFFTSAKVIVFFALLTYVLTGNVITAEKVFVTSALINNIRLVMTLFFSFGIAMGSETLISCQRIQEFLEMEERSETNKVHYAEQRPKPKDCRLDIKNITAKWSDETEEETLQNISCSVKAEELLAIIGPVGAGKGSLLQSVLGELPIKSGSIKVEGKVAYSSQEPWVFSGTIKQNILFGQPFNSKRYHETLKVCALERDLELFPLGDQTLVGERGVSLSGGQKARVNLARAVYFDADIYLLDDPLSAVDTHVGRHLYDQCIKGFLKNKVCVLVTHQLQYLKNATNILVLKEGKLEAEGSYHQLMNTGINFASLLVENPEEQSINIEESSVILTQEKDGCSPIEKRMLSMDPESAIELKKRRFKERSISIDSSSMIPENLMEISALGLAGSELSLSKSIMDSPTPNRAKTKRKIKLKDDDEEKSQPLLIQDVDSLSDEKKFDFNEKSDDIKKPTGAEESKSTGSVSIRVYLSYFLAGGGWCLLLVLMSANIITQVLFSGSEYWLKYWTNGEMRRSQILLNELNPTELNALNSENLTNVDDFSELNSLNSTKGIYYSLDDFSNEYFDTMTNVYIYSAMIVGLFLLSLFRTVIFFVMCMKASKALHKRMFEAVIRVPIKFFDTHPIGQTLNRFTRDLGQIDELLPSTVFDVITIFLNFAGIIIVISIINPWVLLPTGILGLIFIVLRRFYLNTARDIKRLEGVTRSPVFSHLSSSLLGLTTIRAFNVQDNFTEDFDLHQDLHSSAWFLFICTTRWFGICLDWITCVYIAIVTFGFMLMPGASGGDIGLAISQAMMLSGMFQWGVRQSAEVENQMTSVERVLEYSKLEPEAPLYTDKDKQLKKDWPSKGHIEFKDVDLRYDENDPPVLKQLNFSIQGSEKIGIVGRTGAGKSSLLTTLFRLTEPTGEICLDGVPTVNLGLHKVRNSISIIPQDPTLFSGTLRHNIDPFSEYKDDQLWDVLEEVQLKDAVCDLSGKLEATISEGGSNLSVGQRQLVCLARAILKHNRILVMDEATANVDPQTDGLIQQTIRNKFSDCTVLTIAHRLHTIMDSDKVMVMDAGRLKEFDEPYTLASDNTSIFSELIQQTGKSTAAQLIKISKQAYDIKHNPENQDTIETDPQIQSTECLNPEVQKPNGGVFESETSINNENTKL